MVYPPLDFIALRDISINNAAAYRKGDGLYADAVANLGLEVGVDVDPAQPSVSVPAGNASRADWAAYACRRTENRLRYRRGPSLPRPARHGAALLHRHRLRVHRHHLDRLVAARDHQERPRTELQPGRRPDRR